MAPPMPRRSLVLMIWGSCEANDLWQRILKYSIACIAAVSIALLPALQDKSVFLIPMVTVFAHPGQRMGLMIEALLMVLLGSLLGLAWALLGLYLASLVDDSNPAAAYTIRALFFLLCLLVHGYLRSSNPRILIFVLYLVIANLLTIQLPTDTTSALFTSIYIPVLIGAGILLLVNLAIFRELSSSYLGLSTINSLSETVDTLTRATHWFVTPGGDAVDNRPRPPLLAPTLTAGGSIPEKQAKKHRIRQFFSQFPNPFHTVKARSALASVPLPSTKLVHLTEQKPRLRAQLGRCQAAQEEVNFEAFLSPLPPTALKPISIQHMTGIVKNVITLIGACENKFVVVENAAASVGLSGSDKKPDSPVTPESRPGSPKPATDGESGAEDRKPRKKKKKRPRLNKVHSVKPVKELEASSAQLLESILARIRGPVQQFQISLTEASNLVIMCLAYCFDVSTLPSGARAPRGIPLEEIDLRIDQFARSLAVFDSTSAEQLKQATMDQSCQSVDFMPGMETFLVSSFILAFRDSAEQLLDMLHHARRLIEKRQLRRDRSRLWFPQYASLRRRLAPRAGDAPCSSEVSEKAQRAAADDGDGRNPSRARETRAAGEFRSRRNADEESSVGQYEDWGGRQEKRLAEGARRARSSPEQPSSLGWVGKARAKAADFLEWAQHSKHLDFALKLSIAVFLVLWPAFVTSWHSWYAEVRGIWAPMQLILVFDVAIGTSLFGFAVRLFGVVFGCVFGFLAYEIGRGNRIAVAAVLAFGLVPSIYIQVATKYAKAGMVSIVSMTVVAIGKSPRPSAVAQGKGSQRSVQRP
ncbi:hypothetical protein CDD83_1429 [Cordyceps sp. RAO-2017]|nr:hypothetical protein CDD83_1429 [Cordyceps sp. RAO-2017]